MEKQVGREKHGRQGKGFPLPSLFLIIKAWKVVKSRKGREKQGRHGKGFSLPSLLVPAFPAHKTGLRTRGPPPCHISRLSRQRVAPAGRKTHFGQLSKNSIGMVAVCAGPTVKNITLFRLQPARAQRSPP